MATMPQMHWPFFPDAVEPITSEWAFERQDGQVIDCNGHRPVLIHDTPLSTKSQRSAEDAEVPMGVGACNVLARGVMPAQHRASR